MTNFITKAPKHHWITPMWASGEMVRNLDQAKKLWLKATFIKVFGKMEPEMVVLG